jgi:hypothetical protein
MRHYPGRVPWHARTTTSSAAPAADPVAAVTPDSPRAPAPGTAPQAAPSSGPTAAFSWQRQWWPIAVEAQLDGSKPTAAMLLGIPLVIWKDGAGAWSVLEDRCAHRLAPLSEVRGACVRAGVCVCWFDCCGERGNMHGMGEVAASAAPPCSPQAEGRATLPVVAWSQGRIEPSDGTLFCR